MGKLGKSSTTDDGKGSVVHIPAKMEFEIGDVFYITQDTRDKSFDLKAREEELINYMQLNDYNIFSLTIRASIREVPDDIDFVVYKYVIYGGVKSRCVDLRCVGRSYLVEKK